MSERKETQMTARYTPDQIASFIDTFRRDGFVVLPRQFEPGRVRAWADSFVPLFAEHVAAQGHLKNRGEGRYYVTLPFERPWADPEVFENDDVLAVVSELVGPDFVMCQLATDTPVRGSDYQEIHRDTPALFPEWGRETPSFQIAVNFPLCDVTLENGPIEIARGTHAMTRAEALVRLESGAVKLEPFPMQLGDVMIRDVRGLHRGTPNRTDVPRPMAVIGYSRKWMRRPEVSVTIPDATWGRLSPRARRMLRLETRVRTLAESAEKAPEIYQSYAY
jgi:ectoine hydroxylase-related dioxygenase (phytanoyl-CoA dioxygenase family)